MMGRNQTFMKDGSTMIGSTHTLATFVFQSRVQLLVSAFFTVFLSLMMVLLGGGSMTVLLLLLIALPVAGSWNMSASNFDPLFVVKC